MGRELYEQEPVFRETLDHCVKPLHEPRENASALRCALETLGRLWTLGVNVDWSKLHAAGSVQRVSLPTYPFERQKFWIEPDKVVQDAEPAQTQESLSEIAGGAESADNADEPVSLYRRTWKPTPLPTTSATGPGQWLLFVTRSAWLMRLAATSRQQTGLRRG